MHQRVRAKKWKKGEGELQPSQTARPSPRPPLPRRLSLLPSFPLSFPLFSFRRAALPRERRAASRRRPFGAPRCFPPPPPRAGPFPRARRPFLPPPRGPFFGFPLFPPSPPPAR